MELIQLIGGVAIVYLAFRIGWKSEYKPSHKGGVKDYYINGEPVDVCDYHSRQWESED